MAYIDTANSGADAFQPSRSNTKPGGAGVGSLIIFYLGRWHESANFPAMSSVPSNAVLLETLAVGNLQLLVYAKYVEASETTYTFNWGTSRWSRLWSTYFGGRAQGLDLTTLAKQSATGSGTSITSRSVTAAAGDDLAWGVDTHEYSGGETHTPPTSFTEVVDDEAGSAAYRANVSSGSQTASGATISSSQNFAVSLVALPAAASGAAMDLGTASGSGAAQALSASKALTIGPAAGSGTAQPLSLAKSLTLGAAAGSGAPQPMSFTKALALGAATGSGAAQQAAFDTGSPATLELGTATGTGTPQPMSWAKALGLGAAAGSGAPAEIGHSKSLALGTAAGAGAAQALTPGKALALQNATGGGAAQAMAFTAAGQLALGTVTGAGAPQAMAFSKALALSPATGSGAIQALALSKALELGAAAGAGAARAAAFGKALTFGVANGVGNAQSVSWAGPIPEYEAPETWVAVTRPTATVTAATPEYVAVTRRTPYTVSTREE